MLIACVRYLCWVFLVVAASPVRAQSLSDLERRLFEHPSLAQLRHDARSWHEEAAVAMALPDPEISLGVHNVPLSNPSFDRFLPSHKAVGVQQSLPSSAGRKARRAVFQQHGNKAGALAAQRFALLRANLLENLIRLQRIDTETSLLEQQSGKLREFNEVIQSEIDAGRPAVFRLAEISARLAQVSHELVELQGEKDAVLATLIELVGSTPIVELPPPELHPGPESAEYFHAVRVAAVDADIARSDIAVAQAAWKPDWAVELSYQQRSTGRGLPDAEFRGDDWFSARVSFSVPFWGGRRQAPGVRAATSRGLSARAQLDSIKRASTARYAQLLAMRDSAQTSRRLLDEHIAALDDARDALLTRYESGAGDYAPIIDNEITILTLKAQRADLLSREHTATVRANSLWEAP